MSVTEIQKSYSQSTPVQPFSLLPKVVFFMLGRYLTVLETTHLACVSKKPLVGADCPDVKAAFKSRVLAFRLFCSDENAASRALRKAYDKKEQKAFTALLKKARDSTVGLLFRESVNCNSGWFAKEIIGIRSYNVDQVIACGFLLPHLFPIEMRQCTPETATLIKNSMLEEPRFELIYQASIGSVQDLLNIGFSFPFLILKAALQAAIRSGNKNAVNELLKVVSTYDGLRGWDYIAVIIDAVRHGNRQIVSDIIPYILQTDKRALSYALSEATSNNERREILGDLLQIKYTYQAHNLLPILDRIGFRGLIGVMTDILNSPLLLQCKTLRNPQGDNLLQVAFNRARANNLREFTDLLEKHL